MTWVSVGLAVGAAALGWWNQEQVAKKQDRQAAASITNQAAKQRKADAQLADLVKNLSASNQQDEAAAQNQNYLDTLRMGSQASGINQGPGNFSQAYRDDAASNVIDLEAFGRDRAGLMSRIDAPGLQRVNEGILFDNAAVDLGMLQREAQGQDYLDQLRLGSIRANPWVDALATGMGAYASARGGGKDATKVTTVPAATGVGNQFFNFGGLGGLGY